ncbi:MAG: tetratricopeptide repeat protein [Treponema sp.]|nr:tetratricopeptide repeat protein [Treponema sp.]
MNKKIKDSIIGALVLLVVIALIIFVYSNAKSREQRELERRINALSPRGGIPQTIDGLREAINIYESQIEFNVQTGAQTGVYWKILAIRLADRNMHRDALDALERAIHFNTSDPTLFHLTGEYASVVAASVVGFSGDAAAEKEQLTNLAEAGYLRAIELDATYMRPRLGLGVMYTFDLNRPAEAIPHLEKFVQSSPSNVSGMFVLARAYYMTENFYPAIELYDRIIAVSRDQSVQAEAQNNKETIMSQMGF